MSQHINPTPKQTDVTALNSKFTIEGISGNQLFDVVDSSLVEFSTADNSFYKIGRTVFCSVRFTLKKATSGSTRLFTPKSSALKNKWYPAEISANYVVAPAFTTWDADKKALIFLNNTWDLGIGAAQAGEYIATFVYLSRT